jgi:hypothetical protein
MYVFTYLFVCVSVKELVLSQIANAEMFLKELITKN